MISIQQGNLLDADVEALVNAVNTVGVMGKHIALAFKRAYPANYDAYRAACQAGEVRLGRMFVHDSGQPGPRRYIINFPTKEHWSSPSQLADIGAGLEDLIRVVRERGIGSVAVPPLGYGGNGSLDWADVRPLIESAFAELPEVRVLLYPPPSEEPGAPPSPDEPGARPSPDEPGGR